MAGSTRHRHVDHARTDVHLDDEQHRKAHAQGAGHTTRGQCAQLNPLTPHIIALSGPGTSYQFSSSVQPLGSTPGVPSFLSSPGGPYIYDANNRTVILHGVNVVYKHAPYIAYPDPGKPWNFDDTDASRMQALGFNVVRLGIEWQALEPGTGRPNQPAICTPGTPGDPHEFNQRRRDAVFGATSPPP